MGNAEGTFWNSEFGMRNAEIKAHGARHVLEFGMRNAEIKAHGARHSILMNVQLFNS
jgi:hypothetical protein